MASSWYNGYSPRERSAKGRARGRLVKAGTLSEGTACMLCGDSGAKRELHSEDYSTPYLWEPPAAYELCVACHRQKLHKRFAKPHAWKAFVAHVRRGGYASDLADPTIRAELRHAEAAIAAGRSVPLKKLRDRHAPVGETWIDALAMDPESRRSPRHRPRLPGASERSFER